MPSNKKNKKDFAKQIANYALVIGFGVAILFLVTLVVKISGGVAKTVDAPDTIIRLQIISNDPPPEYYRVLIDSLEAVDSDEIEIKIVDREFFDLRPIDQTMIINRDKDKTAAKKLAEYLGLNPDDIVYKPLDNNYNQISVSLVVGKDLGNISILNNEPEEN